MATEAQLTDRIQRIKAALLALGDLRPGALSEQYNTCRSPGCRCKADPPQRHGPYHQLSYSHRGRLRTENIRPDAAHPDRGHGRKPNAGAPSPQTDTGHPASTLEPLQYRAFPAFDAQPPRSYAWFRPSGRAIHRPLIPPRLVPPMFCDRRARFPADVTIRPGA